MPANWITIVSTISLAGIYIFISYFSLKIEGRRQKRLLQIQADKRGGLIDKSLMLVGTIGEFRLLIIPDLYANENNYKNWAVLGWNGSDLSERVSHFPKIAVFRKQYLSFNRNSQWNWEKSQVKKKWKKILLGNKKFNKAFTIYAENEADAHWVLTDEIQQGLLALSSKAPRVRTDEMNFFATSKMIKDIDTYDSFIDTAISISEKLTGTTYEPKQTTGYVETKSNTPSENLILISLKDIKEISMSLFKNLFSKKGEPEGEPFIPTPTQIVPGLEPVIVQAIENLFPNTADQKKAFSYSLEYKGSKYSTTLKLLAMLADSKGKVESLYDPKLWSDGRFNVELADTFSKMKDAEAWVKSITKSQV